MARVEHDCPSFEFVSYKIKWCDEVCIARKNDKCVGSVCVGIAEKRGSEVDVRPLFFHLYHMYKAVCGCGAMLASGIHGRNPCLVLVVVALNDIYAAMGNDGLKIDVLAFNRRWIMRICLSSGDKVLDGYEFVVSFEIGMGKHGLDKRGHVKPFNGWMPTQQSVVEIAAVYICYRFHLLPIKKIGPQALRPKTPFRVGRALRLDLNLLTSLACIVPKSLECRKGRNF